MKRETVEKRKTTPTSGPTGFIKERIRVIGPTSVTS